MCKVDNWTATMTESKRLHEKIINIRFEEIEFRRDTGRDPIKYYRCILICNKKK